MNKNISKIEKQKGFTLVEVMIAVGLFVVVMVFGIGSVLSTNSAHKKSQSQRAINDNLSFVIEDMSRNIRLGSNYRCPIGLGSINLDPTLYEFTTSISDATAQDCEIGDESLTLSFDPMNANFEDPADTADQMAYVIYDSAIYKASASTFDGSAHTFIRITPPEIFIDMQKSGFTVIGTETTGTQPRVIVRLSGTVAYKNITTPFDIQTTLSQRLLEE